MPRFNYRASGYALGGSFVEPQARSLPTVAPVVLPSTGGEAFASASAFDYAGVSFARASTRVSGRIVAGQHVTETEVVVEGLDVLNTVRVDRLVARLCSKHPTERRTTDVLDQISIHAEGTSFGAMDVRGQRVEIVDRVAAIGSNDPASFAELVRQERSRRPSVARLPLVDACLVTDARFGRSADPQSARSSQNGGSDGIEGTGCFIEITGFGRVYPGEMLVDEASLRLSLLRIELDPDAGRGSARTGKAARDGSDGGSERGVLLIGGAEINGHSYP